MLWRAALAPDVWSRLRAEADDVLPATEATAIDAATLAELQYANAVMRETLRLHPAGLVAPREAVVDIRVGDRVVKKGTLVLSSAYLAGRDPAFWPDPLRFDPDRFADLSADQKAVVEQAWVPFSRGAR